MNRYEMEPILNPAGRFVIYGDAMHTIKKLEAQVEDLKSAGRTACDDATSALDLLSCIRSALGDNGTRMQGELLDYCRELAALPGRVAELEAQTPSALKAKLESAEARIAELEAQSAELARIADEHVNTAHRYRDALERLARLGNEPYYGNSIGNRIAQDALGIEVGFNA